MRTLTYFILLTLFTAQACKQTPGNQLSISGRVLDEKTNTPVPGMQVRLAAVLSRSRDSQISTALTDAEGRYTLTTERTMIGRYSQAGFRLRAAAQDTGQQLVHKNPYSRDKKGAPYLFFKEVELTGIILAQNEIEQDLKVQAGAVIACYSPLPAGLADTALLLDVAGLQKPRDHFRMMVYQYRYLVVKPDHPYSLRVIYQYPGDTAAIEYVVKEDTVRLKPMDTLKVQVSYDMIKTATGRIR
jgi:5-hydroxyisourate hydrolase-like protein (transthyretin family)